MVGALIQPSQARAIQLDEPKGHYEWNFVGVADDDTNQTWTYRIDEIDKAQQVSHVSLKVCEDVKNHLISTSPNGGEWIKYDGSIYDGSINVNNVIQWDISELSFTEEGSNETQIVSFTINTIFGTDQTGAHGYVKYANKNDNRVMPGPDCLGDFCQLEIKKTVDKPTALPGDTLLYTLNFNNAGKTNCTGGGVRVDDYIPALTTYANWHDQSENVNFGYSSEKFGANNPGFDGSLLSWNAGTLTPGETGWVKFKVTVDELPICSDETIYNYGTIYADQLPNGLDSKIVETTVTTPCNGTLTVNKVLVPSNDTGLFNLMIDGVVAGTGTNVGNGGTTGAQTVSVGNYVVSENAGTNTDLSNYTSVISGDCDAQGNVTVGNSENKVCTITNTRNTAEFIVYKNVDENGDGDLDDPEDIIGATNWSWNIQNGEQDITTGSSRTLETGLYTISEKQKNDYHVTDLTCNDQSYGAVESRQIDLTTDGIVCTFTNTRDTGKIKVNKKVDADGDGIFEGDNTKANNLNFQWGFEGETLDKLMGSEESVVTGNYNITENNVDDYHFAGWYVNGSIYTCETTEYRTLPAKLGVTTDGIEITLCNARNTADLTLIKQVDNSNGGTAQAIDWKLKATSEDLSTIEGNGLAHGEVLTGTYTLSESSEIEGYTASKWICNNKTLEGNEITLEKDDDVTCTITNTANASKITGYKFEDINGNHVWDNDEPALDDWEIKLYSACSENFDDYNLAGDDYSKDNKIGLSDFGAFASQKVDLNGDGNLDNYDTKCFEKVYQNTPENMPTENPVLDTTTTNANGYYEFDNLSAGSYILEETLKPGWTQTLAPSVITLGINDKSTGNDFGNFQNIDVTVCKYIDKNGDGNIENDSVYNQGWNVYLNEQEKTTNENGCVTYIDIGPGSYNITEETKEGWTQTYPLTGSYNFEAVSGVDVKDGDFDFGNFENASITAYKYIDADGSWKTDNDRTPKPGWTVQLWQGEVQVGDNQVTGADGSYTWTNLEPGTYTVKEILNSDFMAITGTEYEVEVKSGQPHEVIFGNFKLGLISGYKFEDVNNNSEWDEGEEALQGWEICLDENTCTTTNENGYYEFTDLEAGQYNLTETTQEGWRQTMAPAAITIASGIVSRNNNFGNQKLIYEIGLDKIDSKDPVAPGKDFTYTLTWSVGGNDSVNNLTLVDNLPSEVSFVSASETYTYDQANHTVSWNLDTKNPGDTGTLDITVTANEGLVNNTVINNTAVLDSDETDETTADEETTIVSGPILGIEKSVDLTFANPGNVATYTVNISNTGNETAYNVILEDTLPDGFTFVSTGLATHTWELGDLTPGENFNLNYQVAVGKVEAGFYDNLAETWADNHEKIDDSVTLEVRIPAVLSEEAKPVLNIEKEVDQEFVNPNSLVNYTVTVTNTGEATAYDVVLTDTLPAGFTFTYDDSAVRIWTLGNMAPGSEIVINYEVKVGADVQANTYDNLAVVTAVNHKDISDTAPLEVRKGVVLGLAEAGMNLYNFIYILLTLFTAAGGMQIYRLRKRQDISIK
ncbi:MAG: SdrD B-like domain-containing protein [Patescibacteria group bacterium]|nr:SdrD B-like domain-containing protein [Patescibacteria group bacterium]